MSNLSTEYMGLKLENPIVVASCSLSKNIDGIRNLTDNGAGAIVLKSLFEEQIQKEMVEDVEQYISHAWHYEAYDYVNKMGMELGPREYLKLIEDAKKAISIPIIDIKDMEKAVFRASDQLNFSLIRRIVDSRAIEVVNPAIIARIICKYIGVPG